MIGELVGEFAGGLLRFLGRISLDIFFEFLVRGAGYILCRPFGGKRLNPDGALVTVVGLAFWVAVGIAVYQWPVLACLPSTTTRSATRIYAEFNGLVWGVRNPKRIAVVLHTFGSLRDLSNAGLMLHEGLPVIAFDASDENEDLKGTWNSPV